MRQGYRALNRDAALFAISGRPTGDRFCLCQSVFVCVPVPDTIFLVHPVFPRWEFDYILKRERDEQKTDNSIS